MTAKFLDSFTSTTCTNFSYTYPSFMGKIHDRFSFQFSQVQKSLKLSKNKVSFQLYYNNNILALIITYIIFANYFKHIATFYFKYKKDFYQFFINWLRTFA
jgi:hypothetical protein